MELPKLQATLACIQDRLSKTQARLQVSQNYIQYCDMTMSELCCLMLDVVVLKEKKHAETEKLIGDIIKLKDHQVEVLRAMVAMYEDAATSSSGSSQTASSITSSSQTPDDIFEPRSSSPDSQSSIGAVLTTAPVRTGMQAPPAVVQEDTAAEGSGADRRKSKKSVKRRGLLGPVKPPFMRASGKSRY